MRIGQVAVFRSRARGAIVGKQPRLHGITLQNGLRLERFEILFGDPRNDHVLLVVETNLILTVLGGKLYDRAEVITAHATGRNGDARIIVALLLLRMNAQDLFVPIDDLGLTGIRQTRKLLADQTLELVDAPILDEEFQTRLGTRTAETMIAVQSTDHFRDVRHAVRTHEDVHLLGQLRFGSESASYEHIESLHLPATNRFHCWDEGKIVDLIVGVVVDVGGDGDFEFTRKVGVVVVALEPAVHVHDDAARVEQFVGVDAGQRIVHHVAGDIAFGADGGQTDVVESLEDLEKLIERRPVVLHGLAGGQIDDVVAVLVRDPCEMLALLDVDSSTGNLDAQHEHTGRLRLLDSKTGVLEIHVIAGIDFRKRMLDQFRQILEHVEAVFVELGDFIAVQLLIGPCDCIAHGFPLLSSTIPMNDEL